MSAPLGVYPRAGEDAAVAIEPPEARGDAEDLVVVFRGPFRGRRESTVADAAFCGPFARAEHSPAPLSTAHLACGFPSPPLPALFSSSASLSAHTTFFCRLLTFSASFDVYSTSSPSSNVTRSRPETSPSSSPPFRRPASLSPPMSAGPVSSTCSPSSFASPSVKALKRDCGGSRPF